MEIKVNKWGTSAGVILPKPLLELLGTQIGDKLHVEFDGAKMILTKAHDKKK